MISSKLSVNEVCLQLHSTNFLRDLAHLFFTYRHNRIGASAVWSFDSMIGARIVVIPTALAPSISVLAWPTNAASEGKKFIG